MLIVMVLVVVTIVGLGLLQSDDITLEFQIKGEWMKESSCKPIATLLVDDITLNARTRPGVVEKVCKTNNEDT